MKIVRARLVKLIAHKNPETPIAVHLEFPNGAVVSQAMSVDEFVHEMNGYLGDDGMTVEVEVE